MESASGESRKGHHESPSPEELPAATPVAATGPAGMAHPLSADRGHAIFDRLIARHPAVALRGHHIGVSNGNAGEHKLIHALLRAANQSPSLEDFQTWLDEPTYEPADRLLVKHNGQIVAHVQVLDRLAWFGGVRLPIGSVQDLAVLPEYHNAGCERTLLAAAEQALHDRQAIVAFARTDRPDVFRDSGWVEARCQRATQVGVHDILALLSSPQSPWGRRGRSLTTRLWRQVELDALQNVYRDSVQNGWGAIERAEPYWRWLVNRKAHEQLIVAVHGKDEWSELDAPAHIVGYAVTHASRIVELATLPAFTKAGPRLLARACQDAIELGHRDLSLHLSADHPLHELMLAAGGAWTNGKRSGGTLMLKLLNPGRWIETMYPVILARAKNAELTRPLELSIHTERRAYRIELTRRSGHLVRDDRPNPDVACSTEHFAALLLGNLDVAAARAAGHLQIRDDATATHVACLFPPLPVWQSEFDALRF